MWRDIAEAIEPYCVNGAGFIRDRYEEDIIGFYMENHNRGMLTIGLIGSPINVIELPIEEDMRIFYKDPPGTFEGIPDDCDG
jgi:hypothetical protein